MKTLEAKPFDHNAENWKRENWLFSSTVLEADALGQTQFSTHALRSHQTIWFVFAAQTRFLLETGIAGQERLSSPNDTPKPRKKCETAVFDNADRHEKLYGRLRLNASAQGRHEAVGVLSLFSSLPLKHSVQRWSSDFQGLFRVKNRKMAQGSNGLSTLPLIKEKFGLFVDFEFLTEIGSWGTD